MRRQLRSSAALDGPGGGGGGQQLDCQPLQGGVWAEGTGCAEITMPCRETDPSGIF